MLEVPVLEVADLSKSYVLRGGFCDTPQATVQAVDHVSFSIARGQTFGLVGESGSGKTTTGRMIVRVVEPDSGEIIFWDEELGRVDLAKLSDRELKRLRSRIQMVFQDPYSSLDPRMTVLRIVGEPIRATGSGSLRATRERVAQVLELVDLRHEYMGRYPHAFSGGQRQRIGIARALATEPRLIVADEPVSALDVSVQAQILNLLRDLQKRLQLTYLFIAHDLGVIRYISDVIGVMYLGRLVEVADKASLYRKPKHPYTEALLAVAPRPEPWQAPAKIAGPGGSSQTGTVTSGCPYFPRCPYRQDICAAVVPKLYEVSPGHTVACHFDLELANADVPREYSPAEKESRKSATLP